MRPHSSRRARATIHTPAGALEHRKAKLRKLQSLAYPQDYKINIFVLPKLKTLCRKRDHDAVWSSCPNRSDAANLNCWNCSPNAPSTKVEIQWTIELNNAKKTFSHYNYQSHGRFTTRIIITIEADEDEKATLPKCYMANTDVPHANRNKTKNVQDSLSTGEQHVIIEK